MLLVILSTSACVAGTQHPTSGMERERASARELGAQAGLASVAAAVPVYLMVGGDEDEPPTTEGELYTALAKGFGSIFLIGLTAPLPLLPVLAMADERDNTERGALLAVAGSGIGYVTTMLLAKKLPKWARMPLGSLLVGSLTTLGYQLGR